jgi:hypothetical protein
MLNNTPPNPIPMAAAKPSTRERDTAIRDTSTKLGPGLIAPIESVATMLSKTLREDMVGSAWLEGQSLSPMLGRARP